MATPVSYETSGSNTAQMFCLSAHPQSGVVQPFTEMNTVVFDSSESETDFVTQPDPTIISQTTTSDLSSEDASRTHTQDSTTVQTPDVQVSNTLGSNINTLFSYLDIHCHSLYDDWTAPIMFPQYRDKKRFITILLASFQRNLNN